MVHSGGVGLEIEVVLDDRNIDLVHEGIDAGLRMGQEGLGAAVLANAGFAIASEWMFAPELANETVKTVPGDWQLPRIESRFARACLQVEREVFAYALVFSATTCAATARALEAAGKPA
jgi:DNA-binding transcriptional LysR family regulator